MTAASPMELEVAELIVSALNLEVSVRDISPTAPLFDAQAHGSAVDELALAEERRGLGLDSIDALELALAISQRYGFQLKSDDERNHQIFSSLRSLTAHIEKHRTK